MKKPTAALLACLLLCSCSAGGEDSTAASAQTLPAVTQTDGNTSVYADVVVREDFPENCKISYKITQNDAVSAVSLTRTSNGILIRSGAGEQLYIKSDGGYAAYSRGADGRFTLSDTAEPIGVDEINNYIATFCYYCYPQDSYEDSLTRSGEGEAAGFLCDIYTYSEKSESSALDYSFYLEKQTGICLKYTLSGHDESTAGNYAYECTEFIVGGASLPEV